MQLTHKASLLAPLALGGTLLTALICEPVQAGPVVYVNDATNHLAKLDVASGNSTILGTLPTAITDIALSPTGTLYGVDTTFNLWQINPVNATGIDIGTVGSFVNALTFSSDGTLYGAGNSKLFTINVTTAARTKVGTFANYTSSGDLAFDQSGNLFLSATSGSGNDDLLRLNTHTGAATLVGSIGFDTVYGLAPGPNDVLYGMSSDTEKVITINTTTGAGSVLSSYGGGLLSPIYGATSFAQPVPETSTTVSFGLLLCLGVGGMAWSARRKKA